MQDFNDRADVTKGKIYVLENGWAENDQGKRFKPATQFIEYWQFVTRTDYEESLNPLTPLTSPKQLGEKPTMLTIKSTSLINGRDADNLSVDVLIRFIKDEEKAIKELQTVKVESKAITKMMAEHNANIKNLVKILDKK